MSDLDRFELFVYVAQAESLTQAAQLIGITKASISKQIKLLEKELKIDLFSRAHYRLSLTPSGELLLKQCIRLKRELEDTRSLCQQFHQEPEGELKIVAFPYFAHKLIFHKLKDFLTLYPKLKITLEINERMPQFEKEQVDIAIGFSIPAPNSEDIIQAKMGETRYILCAAPSYFKQHGTPKDIRELHYHCYISHTSRSSGLLKLKNGKNLSLRPYLETNSVGSLIECAKQGLGLIQLPIYMLEQQLAHKELIEILPEAQRTHEPIFYYYPKYRFTQPKVRKFVDFFLK